MRKRKLLWRIIAVIILLFLCIILMPLVGVVRECKPFADAGAISGTDAATNKEVTQGLTNYARAEGQTYLTLPEWYIVYSSDEYAAFVTNNPPSRFPYFQATRQYWRGYYDVCAETRERYPFNSEYHTMLGVIGVSFTAENIIKGSYENTVGRLTEWLSSAELTEEDIYAGQVAKEYGDFLHTVPWYEFPFDEKLAGLWTNTSLWGPNLIRKWERKIALSVEYGLKSGYGWLTKQGLASTSAPEDLEIQLWVEGLSDEILQQEPQIKVVKQIDEQSAIVAVPRYEAFTRLMPRLANQGLRFVEIAGNDEILITAIAPVSWAYTLPEGEFLFAMAILTEPELKRVAIKAPVTSLHTILLALENDEANVEHIYDY